MPPTWRHSFSVKRHRPSGSILVSLPMFAGTACRSALTTDQRDAWKFFGDAIGELKRVIESVDYDCEVRLMNASVEFSLTL
jgi:hypothetical protein